MIYDILIEYKYYFLFFINITLWRIRNSFPILSYYFLRTMAAGLPMLYLLFIYRSTLQGLGDTVIPMVSGFVELALRVGTALLLPMLLGYWGVYLAEIAAWIGAGIFRIIGCYHRLRVTAPGSGGTGSVSGAQ
jgi:Na+-driven multidrug efflux pump